MWLRGTLRQSTVVRMQAVCPKSLQMDWSMCGQCLICLLGVFVVTFMMIMWTKNRPFRTSTLDEVS